MLQVIDTISFLYECFCRVSIDTLIKMNIIIFSDVRHIFNFDSAVAGIIISINISIGFTMKCFLNARSCALNVFFVIAFCQISLTVYAKFSMSQGDYAVTISGKTNIGLYDGKNISLINNCNDWDHILYVRQATDLVTNIAFGNQSFNHPVVEAQFGLRNKSSWGDTRSITGTTFDEIKMLDASFGGHSHYIPRQLMWAREAWVQLLLNDVFGFHGVHTHTLTLGLFPFSLGYGISLGDAYAVGSDLLGFYSESAVDQYAPALKFSGMLKANGTLSYDIYIAMLQNRAGTLSDTTAKVFSQEYGRFTCPARGFGSINALYAMRLNWTVFDCPTTIGKMTFEPYGLYNHDPEQYVEFIGDADSKLITIGLSGQFEVGRIALGFDTAFNRGHQSVKGWDRNIVQLQNRNGEVTLVNSHVMVNVDPNAAKATDPDFNFNSYLLPHSPSVIVDSAGVVKSNLGKQAQKLIDGQIDGSFNNGNLIGVVSGLQAAVESIPNVVSPATQDGLYSATNRYRDPYENKYRGAMAVIEAATFFMDRELEWAVAFGCATGDKNPNNEVIDGDFTGFIPLQEFFSGKRVKSAFLLGGSGKLSRPLSVPVGEEAIDDFAARVSGFTDIFYTGTGFRWDSKRFARPFSMHPNFLAYWKYDTVNKFDALHKEETKECARSFLGAELNIFTHVYPVPALKLYFVGSLFIPGGHFKDIKGKPFNKDQLALLNNLTGTSFNAEQIPNIGDDVAFTFNLGIEFSF